MRKTIIAVYDNHSTAEQVVRDLVNSGIERSSIGLALNDVNQEGARLAKGQVSGGDVSAGEGAGFGAVVGGLTGLLVGLGALMIPGVGPIIAAGPLAAGIAGTLVGMGAGAATGGIVAALVDLGVPDEEAGVYAEAIRRGSALVTATVHEDRLNTATQIMRQHNPVDMEQRTTQWRAHGWESFNPNIDPYTAEDLSAERQRRDSMRSQGDMQGMQSSASMGTGAGSEMSYNWTPRSYQTQTGFDQWYDNFYGHYEQNYANRHDYLAMMPAYRQGYYMGADQNYRNREWHEIEPEARQYWERQNNDTLWDDVKDAVRYAWESVKDAVDIND